MTDFMKIMKQAKELQSKMGEAQARLESEEVTGESGAGLVTVTMTAKGEMRRLSIDPSILVPSEVTVVEDLIIAAHNDARRRAEDVQKKIMAEAAGGLQLPPGMPSPFGG
ncbi:YbaB/EbfC family nucleoid-associated protein [Hyphobacterium marinum]|uniref:Nucleoid-associated protein V0U35_03910 n=1 Tax=Hyphobacterium marinum TaxID=3116574 RepID=A0ABU7LXT3_9PROT|nr:YbaB/EbfC family nucleoid-associated protein [Hyphobacterium sp. Y6023]MEE2565815.1 YbaB/EbfC family nucleoid-associated protein [Hyphobacterium sp. Y6023]